EEKLQLVLELHGFGLRPLRLLLEVPRGLRIGFLRGEGPSLLGFLPHRFELAVGPDDLLELGEALAELPKARRIRGDVGRGHLPRELLVSRFDVLEPLFHLDRLSRPRGWGRRDQPSSSSSSAGISGSTSSSDSFSSATSASPRLRPLPARD